MALKLVQILSASADEVLTWEVRVFSVVLRLDGCKLSLGLDASSLLVDQGLFLDQKLVRESLVDLELKSVLFVDLL